MNTELVKATESATAEISRAGGANEDMWVIGRYRMECVGADGEVKWVEEFDNLVVNVGKSDLLQKYFSGSAYTAAWYLGLVDGGTAPTYNAADTMASHAGWTELAGGTTYTGSRPAPTWNAATGTGGGAGSAGTGSKSTTATSFAIIASATVAGAFLNTAATGTAGTLFSAGSFTGGNRAVINGDTLNVTYTVNC